MQRVAVLRELGVGEHLAATSLARIDLALPAVDRDSTARYLSGGFVLSFALARDQRDRDEW